MEKIVLCTRGHEEVVEICILCVPLLDTRLCPPSQVDVVVVVLKSNHGALLPAQLNARWLILLLERRRRKEGSALV